MCACVELLQTIKSLDLEAENIFNSAESALKQKAPRPVFKGEKTSTESQMASVQSAASISAIIVVIAVLI